MEDGWCDCLENLIDSENHGMIYKSHQLGH